MELGVNMGSKFNFKGMNPENLYEGKSVMLCKFYRDKKSDNPDWSNARSYMDGPYIVTDVIKKNDKWQIKLISNKLHFGIHGKKGYYPKTRVTVNKDGVSNIISCSSEKGVYGRKVIYNCIIG